MKKQETAMKTKLRSENRKSQASTGDPRSQLLKDLPVVERRLSSAGVSTAILEGGDGPPAVLLHGPGESSLWWMRVIPKLTSTHHVIVPDLPGHGASRVIEGSLDEDHTMEWLGGLIDQCCNQPPILVGHLLGGAIAARFAIKQRAPLHRLILVDSLGLGRFRPALRFAFELIRFMMRPNEKTHARFFPQCVFDADGLREQMGDRWDPFLAYSLEGAHSPEAKTALQILMRKVGVPRIPPAHLERINVPTHLIWGRHDKAIRLKIAQAASDRYGWPLHVIDEARDDPKLEQPNTFLQAFYHILETTTPHRRI